jgi:hypothetical protein
MPTVVELVARSGDLKRELVEFAQQPRFGNELQRAFDDCLGGLDWADDEPRLAASGGAPTLLPVATMDVFDDLRNAETVGLIYDEIEGLGFFAEFGTVHAAFADPALLRRRLHRELVQSYLKDDSVSPLVFRRLAAADPDRASQVFQRLLSRPRFRWDRDGEPLLRRYKPAHFGTPPLPHVVPISDRLTAQFASPRRVRGEDPSPSAIAAAPAAGPRDTHHLALPNARDRRASRRG